MAQARFDWPSVRSQAGPPRLSAPQRRPRSERADDGLSRGIGLAIAERLVAGGAKVVITARNKEALEDAVARLGGLQYALGVAGYADDVEHQGNTVRRAIEVFGSADILVNNTGINPTYG